MMNNDNAITTETKLFGFIAENAHSNRFSSMVNKMFKNSGINAMVIPMNIRNDDIAFTITQMRDSKLNGAVIGSEYQSDAALLADHLSNDAKEEGLADFIRIEKRELFGEMMMPKALEKYAESDDLKEDVALRSLCRYFYDLIEGEKE